MIMYPILEGRTKVECARAKRSGSSDYAHRCIAYSEICGQDRLTLCKAIQMSVLDYNLVL